MKSSPFAPFASLRSTGFYQNLTTNPLAFLTATAGLMFILAVKIIAERRRGPGGPDL